MRPPDLPGPEAFAGRPHGTRLRYISGCKCSDCRRANTQYELQRAKARRAGEWNGLVSAAIARNKLASLSRRGVGRRSIQQFTGISDTVLFEIRSGRKKKIRAATHRKILACGPGAIADGGRIDGTATAKRIAWLLSEGFTKRELARQLGSTAKVPSLQIRPGRVTRRTADRVERLYMKHFLVAA